MGWMCLYGQPAWRQAILQLLLNWSERKGRNEEENLGGCSDERVIVVVIFLAVDYNQVTVKPPCDRVSGRKIRSWGQNERQ